MGTTTTNPIHKSHVSLSNLHLALALAALAACAANAALPTGYTEHIGNTVKYPTPMDLYWMKIWDDGELVRNYIAVSNTATGSVGLYDTANEVFYGNANPSSATFIGGPALLEPQPAQRHTIITVR